MSESGSAAELHLISAETDGGHEVDQPPSRKLFRIVVVLTAVLVFSGFALAQLFELDAQEETYRHAGMQGTELKQLMAESEATLTTARANEATPGTFIVPIEEAKKLVLADHSKLKAAKAPAGWVHPDDRK